MLCRLVLEKVVLLIDALVACELTAIVVLESDVFLLLLWIIFDKILDH